MKIVALLRLTSYFPLLVQRKVTKAYDTPSRFSPSVLALHLRGDSGTRIFNPQTVLVTEHLPLKPKVLQRGIESQNHMGASASEKQCSGSRMGIASQARCFDMCVLKRYFLSI